jgi:hypothetical protein
MLGGVAFLLRRFFSKSPETIPTISASVSSASNSPIAIGNNVSQQFTTVRHHQPTPDRKPTKPSPNQIMKDLSILSPFDKLQAPEKYRGLSVRWLLTLGSMDRKNDMWHVIFWSLPSVAVTAEFTELPLELKIAPTNAAVLVQGRIRDVQAAGCMRLEDGPEILEVRRPGEPLSWGRS